MRLAEFASEQDQIAIQQLLDGCHCAAAQQSKKRRPAKPFNTPRPVKPIRHIQPVKPVQLAAPSRPRAK